MPDVRGQKTQEIRLVDVFLLGPFMVWQGSKIPDPLPRFIMMAAGTLTILFNGANYLEVRRGG